MTFAAQQTLPNVPPAPTAAVYDTGTDLLTVTFDQVLRPATVQAANWVLSLNNYTCTPQTARISAARQVEIAYLLTGGTPSCDEIDYKPPPFDIRNLRLTATPEFIDFPVTVI